MRIWLYVMLGLVSMLFNESFTSPAEAIKIEKIEPFAEGGKFFTTLHLKTDEKMTWDLKHVPINTQIVIGDYDGRCTLGILAYILAKHADAKAICHDPCTDCDHFVADKDVWDSLLGLVYGRVQFKITDGTEKGLFSTATFFSRIANSVQELRKNFTYAQLINCNKFIEQDSGVALFYSVQYDDEDLNIAMPWTVINKHFLDAMPWPHINKDFTTLKLLEFDYDALVKQVEASLTALKPQMDSGFMRTYIFAPLSRCSIL